MIFPRYHQLDAVRSLESRREREGVGHELPDPALGRQRQEQLHRLAGPPAGEPARRQGREGLRFGHRDHRPAVLDQQLQDTIYQFEHKQGVVQKIDEDSSQLGEGAEGRHADHHHDAAEVPLRAQSKVRRPARSAATP